MALHKVEAVSCSSLCAQRRGAFRLRVYDVLIAVCYKLRYARHCKAMRLAARRWRHARFAGAAALGVQQLCTSHTSGAVYFTPSGCS